jgi:hypothetical protein
MNRASLSFWPRHLDGELRSSAGSFAMLRAIRRASSRSQAGRSRGGLPFGAAWLDVTAQDDACRRIYQMGLFARSADDRLVCMGIHDYIVSGKALNAKARVQAAVDE